eukprot:jgi/Tetstr1/454058/TSEL_040977.t1
MSDQPSKTCVSAVRERLVYGFNTFYGDLLASLARADAMIKKRLKKGYRVLDRKSDAYLVEFHRSAKESGALGRVFDTDGDGDAGVAELQVARGLRYRDIPPGEFPTVRLLCAFSWLFGELCAAADEADTDEADREAAVTAVNELFERLVESVSRIQAGMPWGTGLEGMVDDEARDVFRATLSALAGATRASVADAAGAAAATGEAVSSKLNQGDMDAMASAFDMMKCSKLGSIVQEISESIDKDELRRAVESGDLLCGNNVDLMGNLFKQVSGAITGKLMSGEISQEDLLRETTSLMSNMKGGM